MPEPLSGRVALARALFRIGALRFGRFTVAGGESSSYYLDLGVVPSDAEAYQLALAACLAAVKQIGVGAFDVVAGVATAGVTVSSPVAYVLKKPMVYARREEERHGAWKLEGAVRPGWRALVIDGLVTTGESMVSAVEALRRSGCTVEDALVLVDRLEGGKESLARSGVKLSAFVDVKELVETLFQEKKVTKTDYQAALRQLEGGRARA
ncbi:MAG: orotate phosphoribosyltransferase [Nitrososphaerota archaeon]|nr:orotate phosphoribosyltransferase [Nitrososphaerota archaeon]MDG7024825.1 orotate phosphoribosyltransferase [Nitrososphaerota archaeon]